MIRVLKELGADVITAADDSTTPMHIGGSKGSCRCDSYISWVGRPC